MRLISCVDDREVEVVCETSFEINVSFSFLRGALFKFIKIIFFHGAWKQQVATATRTSLKKWILRSFGLHGDYSYSLTLSNVDEPS